MESPEIYHIEKLNFIKECLQTIDDHKLFYSWSTAVNGFDFNFDFNYFIGISNSFRGYFQYYFLWEMTQHGIGDKWILVRVKAWCHQATSRYLNHCLPRYTTSHGITRSQWIKKQKTTTKQTNKNTHLSLPCPLEVISSIWQSIYKLNRYQSDRIFNWATLINQWLGMECVIFPENNY